MTEEEKYYYFPTMTKKIMFIRGEKYVCVDSWYAGITEKQIFTLHNFKNNDWRAPIEFKDESGKIFRISCFDCGSFISLKDHRKLKILKINKCNLKV